MFIKPNITYLFSSRPFFSSEIFPLLPTFELLSSDITESVLSNLSIISCENFGGTTLD